MASSSSTLPASARLALLPKFPNTLSLGTQALQPEPLTHFDLFPLLPTELRLQIWRSAFPPPQIIETRCYSDTIINRDGPLRRTTDLPTVLLQINRESREETLRHYTLVPRYRDERQDLPEFFCFRSDRDVLHIYYDLEVFLEDPFWSLNLNYEGCLDSIRMLEICVSSDLDILTAFVKQEYMFVTRLRRLEKIYITHQAMPEVEREMLKDYYNKVGIVDVWIADFREFLFEFRDDFHRGKAPKVIVGASDAVGTRARRPEPQYGIHILGMCRCGLRM